MGAPRTAALALLALACASPGPGPTRGDDYFRYIGAPGRGGEWMALRWLDHQMPLRVHLPIPAAGLFEDAEAVHDSVRDGVTDWADVARPGVPSFRFVSEPGEADIRIVWATESDGDWYIAFCSMNSNAVTRTHSVEKILVSARWPDGRMAGLEDLYTTVLHEMGHALGFYGHSPDPGDIMYPTVGGVNELSERDRNTLTRLYSVGNGRTIAGGKRSD